MQQALTPAHNHGLPRRLQPGDRLCVIATSGTVVNHVAIERGVAVWQQRGYQVRVPANLDRQWGYLAGTDEQRLEQLYAALQDPDCRAILCARGGYGGARLLETWSRTGLDKLPPRIDYPWLIGFSDVTALLWGLYTQGFRGGVHAPVLTTLADEPLWTIDRLINWLETHIPPAPLQGTSWVKGQATGILLPANLTVATHLLHTPWQPTLTGAILALEDVGEAPYRLDRLLTQWRMSGVLHQVAGIALGRFSQCYASPNRPSFTMEEVLHDRLADLGIPIVADLPFGHDGENAALPVGLTATLDGDAGLLKFDEIDW